jgi:hypothetical protein
MNKSVLKIIATLEKAPARRWNGTLGIFLEYYNAFVNSHENPEPDAKKYQAKAKKHLARFLAQVARIESGLPREEHITKGFNIKNPVRLYQFLKYYDHANIYLGQRADMEGPRT